MPEGKGLAVDKVLQKSAKTDNDSHQHGVCLIYSFEENRVTDVVSVCVCARMRVCLMAGILDKKCTLSH